MTASSVIKDRSQFKKESRNSAASKIDYRTQRDLNKTLAKSINRLNSALELSSEIEFKRIRAREKSEVCQSFSSTTMFKFKADARENSITNDRNFRSVANSSDFQK